MSVYEELNFILIFGSKNWGMYVELCLVRYGVIPDQENFKHTPRLGAQDRVCMYVF